MVGLFHLAAEGGSNEPIFGNSRKSSSLYTLTAAHTNTTVLAQRDGGRLDRQGRIWRLGEANVDSSAALAQYPHRGGTEALPYQPSLHNYFPPHKKEPTQMHRTLKDNNLKVRALQGKRIERSFGFSLFSCPFSALCGTFDYLTAFGYNYGKKTKEVTIWENS